MSEQNTTKATTFVKDQFYVDGVISCKYITSVYSEEYKQKIGKEKLRFDLANDQFNCTLNDQIINQLKNKELYFLKKTLECAPDIKFPLTIKTMLDDNEVTITEAKTDKDGQIIILRKQYLEKTETCTTISDKVTNLTLKVDFDVNEKTIKPTKTGSTSKLSLTDLIQLVKSENLKLRIRIQCGAVYLNNKLHISGTLEKISLEQSKMAQIYSELKDKENKVNLIPKNNMYISQFPKKSSTVVSNIVNILANEEVKSKKKS